MKIVVIGGTGLIGSKVVEKLLAGAQVVVDVANSPSFADQAAMDFFQTAGKNLAAAEAAAGIKHHVALSVVGTERLQDSGYFRAKLAQEKLIKSATIPWSIVHATQFFEFVGSMAASAEVAGSVHFAPVLFQPMASADVARDVLLADRYVGIEVHTWGFGGRPTEDTPTDDPTEDD